MWHRGEERHSQGRFLTRRRLAGSVARVARTRLLFGPPPSPPKKHPRVPPCLLPSLVSLYEISGECQAETDFARRVSPDRRLVQAPCSGHSGGGNWTWGMPMYVNNMFFTPRDCLVATNLRKTKELAKHLVVRSCWPVAFWGPDLGPVRNEETCRFKGTRALFTCFLPSLTMALLST